jgi:YbgC/YbaW family acyl-CoA thioester hydrolase
MTLDPGSLPDPGVSAFETFFRVRFHEVDALGHVNNAAYLNYLEQGAIDHATFLGLDLPRLQELGGVFVARRHEIVFLKPTFAGDLLRVVTWLGEPRGARVDRQYLVFRERGRAVDVPVWGRPVTRSDVAGDGLLAARATTEWVFAGNQGQPRRIPSEIVSIFQAGTREGTDADSSDA